MANWEELKKRIKNPFEPSEKEDILPYDPEANLLTNIGRWGLSNIAKSEGYENIVPMAGVVKGIAKGAAEHLAPLAAKEAAQVAESTLARQVLSKEGELAKKALLNPVKEIPQIKNIEQQIQDKMLDLNKATTMDEQRRGVDAVSRLMDLAEQRKAELARVKAEKLERYRKLKDKLK